MSFVIPDGYVISSTLQLGCWRLRPTTNILHLEFFQTTSSNPDKYEANADFIDNSLGPWSLRYVEEDNLYKLILFKGATRSQQLASTNSLGTTVLNNWQFVYNANITLSIVAEVDNVIMDDITVLESLAPPDTCPFGPFTPKSNRCPFNWGLC